MPEIVLASQSPRRNELLRHAFFSFITVPSDADETIPAGLSPAESAVAIAKRKVSDVKNRVAPGSLIIGADTIVVCDGKLLGKPRSEPEAREMLTLLSGRTHTVYTGLVLSQDEKEITGFEATDVTFRKLTPEMISSYISTGEPMDKAGAYGIQEKGAFLVEKINGDYFNVVGLPLCRLGKMLEELDIMVL